jgi:hypothetical protein
MNEQIDIEGTLNVYELAKLYHTKRPGIWRHSVRHIFSLFYQVQSLFSIG